MKLSELQRAKVFSQRVAPLVLQKAIIGEDQVQDAEIKGGKANINVGNQNCGLDMVLEPVDSRR